MTIFLIPPEEIIRNAIFFPDRMTFQSEISKKRIRNEADQLKSDEHSLQTGLLKLHRDDYKFLTDYLSGMSEN